MVELQTHIIILTKNRPELLIRCISNTEVHNGYVITIIDDSSPAEYSQAKRLLLSKKYGFTIKHLSATKIFSKLKSVLPLNALEWMNKIADRDISPLRNLSLLISYISDSKLTILIDDDVSEFDLDFTYKRVIKLIENEKNIIAGAYISGVDERGIIERLDTAVTNLETCSSHVDLNNIKEFFRIPEPHQEISPQQVSTVSGGYLAFSISSSEAYIAFLPGYNEDWLWCIANMKLKGAKVFRIPQVVLHDPASIRNPTENDIWFELKGDLIFDIADKSDSFILKVFKGEDIPYQYLRPFVEYAIQDYEISELLKKSNVCTNTEILYNAGLKSLKEIYSKNFMDHDWMADVAVWTKKTRDNQYSFELTLNADKEKLKQSIYKEYI